ncbi:MBL fold metallo-hydrolase [Pseudomonas sp. NPDC090755]|uniref:MBL fold metallo-hydrolase n=1 Tax=Pseudomonas sp. NPDC090755 TaxID=3364481 RepID=UPI00383AACB2
MNKRFSILRGQCRQVDGGQAFGTVPQKVWANWLRPDHHNLIELPSSALLVQQEGRNILVLASSDMLLAPLPRTCRCQNHTPSLLDSLAQAGLTEQDIDLVVLTHLQAQLDPQMQAAVVDGDMPRLLFPRARYLVGEGHWQRAQCPHPRDRKLFVRQILWRLEISGRLDIISGGRNEQLGADWYLHVSDGFTPGQLLPEIRTSTGPILFAGDLIPGTHWLALEVSSGFERNPEQVVEEKEQLLDHLVANRGRVVLARDPQVVMAKITRDKKAQYQAYDTCTDLLRYEA